LQRNPFSRRNETRDTTPLPWRLHGTCNQGRILTRLPWWRCIRDLHHQRLWSRESGNSFGGTDETGTGPRAPLFHDDVSGFFTTRNILRTDARQNIQNRNHKADSVAALSLARRLSELFKFALASVSGFRLVPSAQAPRFGRARSREPRDPGLPSRLSPDTSRKRTQTPDNKKPSGAAGSGGSV